MKNFRIVITLFSIVQLSSCLAANDITPQNALANELFPQTLLQEFLTWEAVLPNEETFTSRGHGGPLVRAYFNSVAEVIYHSQSEYPFPEGSILAKAVVANDGTSSAQASRVYFMRKMDVQYDAQNSNWAYGFANRQSDGRYQFNASQGRVASCIECHVNQEQYDYARTVKFYRDAHPGN